MTKTSRELVQLHGMTLDVQYSSHWVKTTMRGSGLRNLDLIDVINEAYIIEMKTTVVESCFISSTDINKGHIQRVLQ